MTAKRSIADNTTTKFINNSNCARSQGQHANLLTHTRSHTHLYIAKNQKKNKTKRTHTLTNTLSHSTFELTNVKDS